MIRGGSINFGKGPIQNYTFFTFLAIRSASPDPKKKKKKKNIEETLFGVGDGIK